jgi:hypothetical protein
MQMMTLKTCARVMGLSILLLQVTAQADLIQCQFTEPFVTTVYNLSQRTLVVMPAAGQTEVIKHVSLEMKAPGKFELVGPTGEVLQKLALTGKGSDGMSDRVYPFDVVSTSLEKVSNGGQGGCTSDFKGQLGNLLK